METGEGLSSAAETLLAQRAISFFFLHHDEVRGRHPHPHCSAFTLHLVQRAAATDFVHAGFYRETKNTNLEMLAEEQFVLKCLNKTFHSFNFTNAL